ncbi:MAG: protein kinase [Polyangiaceae bacterium]
MNSTIDQNVYPRPGDTIDGKYQVERMLGEGGMGAVAMATHLLRRAPVALKFMSPQVISFPGAVERFVNEAVAASQIDSDHVVKIFDVGKLPTGAPFLVMEYLQGRDLAAVLETDGRPHLDIGRSIHFTLQVLRGLQVAHAANIVHRDMKPSNCFIVTKDGEPDFVKLVDFGISKVQQPGNAALTQANSALGTPLYMSPEQAKSPRDVDLRSDLYSVGVILYEMLTGRTPFTCESGELTEILFKIFTAEPPPITGLRPDLPPGLATVIHRALVREPEQRFATAGEFGEALAPWSDGRSASVLAKLRQFERQRGPAAPGTLPWNQASAEAYERARMEAEAGQAPTPAGGTDISPAAQTGAANYAVGAARVSNDDVHAQTMGFDTNAAEGALAKAGSRTDLGATRDTGTRAPSRMGASAALLAIPVLLVAAGIGAALVLKRPANDPTNATIGRPVDTMSPVPVVTSVPSAAPPDPLPTTFTDLSPTLVADAAATKPDAGTRIVPTPRPNPVAAPTPVPTAKTLKNLGRGE